MGAVTDMLDRLSGVASVREKLAQQEKVLESVQRVLLDHQRDISELKGSLKAVVALSSSRRTP